MILHALVIHHYAPNKTDVDKMLFRDIQLDISAAGLVVTQTDGVQVFVPAHMILMAKFVDRAHFKAADRDPDMKEARSVDRASSSQES